MEKGGVLAKVGKTILCEHIFIKLLQFIYVVHKMENTDYYLRKIKYDVKNVVLLYVYELTSVNENINIC